MLNLLLLLADKQILWTKIALILVLSVILVLLTPIDHILRFTLLDGSVPRLLLRRSFVHGSASLQWVTQNRILHGLFVSGHLRVILLVSDDPCDPFLSLNHIFVFH